MCSHSCNTTSHTCTYTGEKFTINSSINCTTPGVVYCLQCVKDTGVCSRLRPQYIGVTSRPAKVRFSEHLGSAIQPCQADTAKPIGVHFRSAGHSHSDMQFLPIEEVKARTSLFWKPGRSIGSKSMSVLNPSQLIVLNMYSILKSDFSSI